MLRHKMGFPQRVQREPAPVDIDVTPTASSVKGQYDFDNDFSFSDDFDENDGENSPRKGTTRELTIPKPFNLSSRGNASSEGKGEVFVPLVVKMLEFEKPVVYKVSSRVNQGRKLTMPISPFLATRVRGEVAKVEAVKVERAPFKATEIFKGNPVFIRPSDIELTIPVSPNIQKKLSSSREEKAKVVKSRNIQPFHLLTEERGASYERQFAERISKEEKENKLRREFKGKRVTGKEAFVPRASTKSTTEANEFKSYLNERMENRKVYELEQTLRGEEERLLMEKVEKARQIKDRNELIKLRKSQVHKAKPINSKKFIKQSK